MEPPERSSRRYPNQMAGGGADPPTVCSDISSIDSYISRGRYGQYDDGASTQTTIAAGHRTNNTTTTAVTMPPSVLRNGGINSGTGAQSSSSSRGNSRPHSELRKERISSTRRSISNNHNDSHSSCVSDSHHSYISFIDNVVDVLPPLKRSRFALAISALVGVAGLLAVSFHRGWGIGHSSPSSEPFPTSTKKQRVLKQNTAHHDDAATAIATATNDFLDDFNQRRRRMADLPDGTVFTEPAHTRMCRAIIDRLDQADAGVTSFEQLVFTESEYVCRDPDTPYTAVLNMMAAQLLDAANNDVGLNVDYTHRCAKWERFCTGNLTTVQFHLPDPLSMQAYAFQPGCVDATSLRTICTDSLAAANPTDPANILFPAGYLNPTDNTCNLGCYFSQVLPWVRNNLRTVATEWLNAVEARALTFWLRNAAEFSHREKDDMEVAVVSLSCQTDECDMSMATCNCPFEPLPNWVYAMHIPRSSTNVAIVVSPTCAKFGQGCELHAQELYHFFHSLYPRADVTYNIITSTSSWYMRMITADHLVCPPGVGCLLPAIARDAYTYVYETTEPTIVTWLTCVPQDYINRLTLPSFPPAFLQGDCRHLRARVGEWTTDLGVAANLQYDTPVDGYLGCADANFNETAEEPYRSPTTYRWDETIWATCPVDVVASLQTELCTQMDRLSLTRILFVGDHTTMTQAISLASILGDNTAISTDPNVVPNFEKTITCAGTGIGSFTLEYVRNDRLEEPGTTPSPGTPNCGPTNEQYCYPWSADYQAHVGKQLLVVNTGYHWGDDWQGYITNFQNFVGRIDEIAGANAARADDIIMFRTSIPGHKECDLHNFPYGHYGEYCPRIVNGAFWHWWGELPPYNDYAIRIINEWNLLNTVKNGPDIELLDPWMMTVLRPDGHLSGSDAGPSCAMDPQECMLYSLPGPVDFWNHLLLMQLQDVATHLENNNPMHAWR